VRRFCIDFEVDGACVEKNALFLGLSTSSKAKQCLGDGLEGLNLFTDSQISLKYTMLF
jgi:hypothetical protein